MNTDTQTPSLAPVYLDNKPISLKDPKPKVSAILSASGKPETTDVKWLQFQPNTQGKPLRNEEVLDRTTDPSKPIYLTSTAKGQAAANPAWKGKEAEAGFTPAIVPGFGEGAKTVRPMGAKAEPHKALQGDESEGMPDDEAGGEGGPRKTDE